MVFKIGDNDYSDKVLMDTFDVNRVSIYTQWEDANGNIHRSEYRKQIQGQFDMQISKLSEYQAFIQDIQANTNHDGWIECHIAVNNVDTDVVAKLFVSYTAVRTMNNNYTKGYLSFTVTIEER